MDKPQQTHKDTDIKGFMFNVDILIPGTNKEEAQEILNNILKSSKIMNYKILNAITPDVSETKNDNEDIANLIEYFKNNQTLIRLTVIKAKGVKLSIPCRVLNYDPPTQHLTVYHVDEKKVYQLHLSEIDDFKVN